MTLVIAEILQKRRVQHYFISGGCVCVCEGGGSVAHLCVGVEATSLSLSTLFFEKMSLTELSFL